MTTTEAQTRQPMRASRRAPAIRTLGATWSATACAASTRSTARRADRPAAADVVDHPLAPLEDADPLPRAPLPGRDVRRARQRQLRPPGERLRRARVRGRRARRDRRHGDRARRARRRSRAAPSARCCWPPSHPERVDGAVSSARRCRSASAPASRATVDAFNERLDTDEGWAKYNRHYWLRDYEGFLEFFFAQVFTEPHSTKPIEDCVGWGLETTAETLVATELATSWTRTPMRELCARALPGARDPGTEDAITGPTAASRSPR